MKQPSEETTGIIFTVSIARLFDTAAN